VQGKTLWRCSKAHYKYVIQARQNNKQFLDEYKIQRGCQRCGHNTNPVALELQELEKSDVLCTTCHRLVHRESILPTSSVTEDAFHYLLRSHIDPLVKIGYYDTAVREGCLLIECKLKEITGTDKYGQNLVESFLEQWKDSLGGYTTASWKIIRGELRTIIKFLRNYYAHNCVTVDAKQAYAMLTRISRTLQVLDAVNGKDSE
jgi:hypothetical protein